MNDFNEEFDFYDDKISNTSDEDDNDNGDLVNLIDDAEDTTIRDLDFDREE